MEERIILRAALVCLFLACAHADVRFFVVGDWGYPIDERQEEVAVAMADMATTFNPEFILTTGDNFYNNGINSTDDPFIDTAWRNVYLSKPSLANVPWWVSLGNHDYGRGNGEEWNQVALDAVDPLWNCPHLWYLLQRTDGTVTVDIVAIDTEALRHEENNPDEMLTWLDTTLAASTADWLIVFGHHQIYSCSGAAGPVYQVEYDTLRPVLDKHRLKLDMFIAGHDHNVQHLTNMTNPLYFDYFISGTGGGELADEKPTYSDILRDVHFVQKEFMAVVPGYSAMTATTSSLQIDFFDHNNTLIYSHSRP